LSNREEGLCLALEMDQERVPSKVRCRKSEITGSVKIKLLRRRWGQVNCHYCRIGEEAMRLAPEMDQEGVPSKVRCRKSEITGSVKIKLFILATSLAVSPAISAIETLGTLHPQSIIADSPKHLGDALTLVLRKDDVAFDRMVAYDTAMICDTEMQVVVDQFTQDWVRFHIKEHPELTFYTESSHIDFKKTSLAAPDFSLQF
jgi:hypothetical protein